MQGKLAAALMAAAVWAAVATIAAAAPAPAPAIPCRAFTAFWNVGGATYRLFPVTKWGFVDGTHTQTGGSCTQPNCTNWRQGSWPTLNLKTGEPSSNGGVPQAANLTAHLLDLEEQINGWLPDPNWNGNAVFDFESWTPTWAANDGSDGYHDKHYQNYSRFLVKQAHPDWTPTQIENAAQEQFETAAVNFMVKTLEKCRELRPKAYWGFYGFPTNPYAPCNVDPKLKCGYNNPLLGPALRLANDRLMALFNASNALYPSIYIPEHTDKYPDTNRRYIEEVTAETIRLAGKTGRNPKVLPFAWSYYHNGTTPLTKEDMLSSFQAPAQTGADGVVLWGDPDAFKHVAQFGDVLKDELGPLVESVLTKACECSSDQCNGNGRCVGANGTACACFPGHSGTHCENTNAY